MLVQVGYLTRRGNRGVSRRDQDATVEFIRIGRGTKNEVYLPDPRVALDHVEIHVRDGQVYASAVGSNDLSINGAAATSGRVRPGDAIAVGPYKIEIVEAPPGYGVAVTVELVQPLGDDLVELTQRSRARLGDAAISKRVLSWAAFVTVLLLFLVLPVAAFFIPDIHKRMTSMPISADKSWESGEISGVHKYFASDCTTCHERPFIMVQDQACLTCHSDITHHADVKTVRLPALEETRCAACHKEHQGRQPAIQTAQALCDDCHVRLTAIVPTTKLINVSDFGRDHPEFRPSVVTDPATRTLARLPIGDPALKENSNLIFPHDKHLVAAGVRGPTGLQKMVCNDCHRPETGGVGMRAVNMETECRDCHKLKFEAHALDREVPHGKPDEVAKVLNDFYGRVALEGGFEDPEAPAVVRRRPGSPLDEAARTEALAWARSRADATIEVVYGKSICGSCHVVERTTRLNERPNFRVKPVLVAATWMPKGKFDHSKHKNTDCADCHAAPKSVASSDVLLPGIANCRRCHGGEDVTALVPSTCVACHVFHTPAMGPMRPRAVGAAASGAPGVGQTAVPR
ncbi:MAG: hypothetical protein EXQ89_02045 [Rhodospirillaceae bacterium]|nr:hypothetical protein [Rhodospirillaceae bacterium]